MNILIFGPNGSGKGTQGVLIKKTFGIAHIESGVLFRENIEKGTPLGKQVKAYLDSGSLVPDTITIPMILEKLKEQNKKGWLLDGFPRNLNQAEVLYNTLQEQHITIDYVIEITLPRDIAKKRIMGRRICKKDNTHPNNTSILALQPNADNTCAICHSELITRQDDQDEHAIDTRHNIYYDTKTGTLAAVQYFKKLAKQGKTHYIQLDGHGNIDEVSKNLLDALQK